jgi:hypothetical protein
MLNRSTDLIVHFLSLLHFTFPPLLILSAKKSFHQDRKNMVDIHRPKRIFVRQEKKTATSIFHPRLPISQSILLRAENIKLPDFISMIPPRSLSLPFYPFPYQKKEEKICIPL